MDHTKRSRAKIRKASKKRSCSVETRLKLSIAKMGYKHTFEAKAKMSAKRKGRSPSKKHRKSLSLALTGRKQSAEQKAKRKKQKPPFQGRRHSEKTKDIMRRKATGRSSPTWGRKQNPKVVARRIKSRLATLAARKKLQNV